MTKQPRQQPTLGPGVDIRNIVIQQPGTMAANQREYRVNPHPIGSPRAVEWSEALVRELWGRLPQPAPSVPPPCTPPPTKKH